MPFCSQCGSQAGTALYCPHCGSKQPSDTAPSSAAPDPLGGLNPRTASILCYIPGIGWIASIIVLASGRFRHDRLVRFHGFQGLYLFVAWLLDDQVLRPLLQRIPELHLHPIIQAVLLGMSIFMMVKASHDEAYPLPLFGELAQKSVAED
ncbi:MAG: hypothetical protein ABSC05_04680 [Candidatus Solibacter sp.]|jgi:uncharacterized membrane protein